MSSADAAASYQKALEEAVENGHSVEGIGVPPEVDDRLATSLRQNAIADGYFLSLLQAHANRGSLTDVEVPATLPDDKVRKTLDRAAEVVFRDLLDAAAEQGKPADQVKAPAELPAWRIDSIRKRWIERAFRTALEEAKRDNKPLSDVVEPPQLDQWKIEELREIVRNGWGYEEFLQSVGRRPPSSADEYFESYPYHLHDFVGRLSTWLGQAMDDIDWLTEQLGTRKVVPKAPLTVDNERMTVTCGSETYDISSRAALRWLKVLADRPGVWVSGAELAIYDSELLNVRTDQLKGHIPTQIRQFIESTPGRGSRLRAE